MMGYRRMGSRGMSLRPVHRIKHVIDVQGGLVAGTQVRNTIIETVDAPTLTNTNEVETGSKVNGIYLHVEAYAIGDLALSNVYMGVFKNPADQLSPPSVNQVGKSPLKKYFVHQSMVIVQELTAGNPRVLFDGVIKFPKGYIRNGPADKWEVILLAPGVNMSFCFQCHYKEFR